MDNIILPSGNTIQARPFNKKKLGLGLGFMVILVNPAQVIHTLDFDHENNKVHNYALMQNLIQITSSRLEAERIKLASHIRCCSNPEDRKKLQDQLENIKEEHPEWLI